MDFNARRIVLQVSGSQSFDPPHHDVEFCRAHGYADVFANGSFILALATKVVTDWCGDKGWLSKFRMEIRRQTRVGDRTTFRGKVTGKRVENGQYLVEVEVWGENQRDGVSVPCRGEVILPAKRA